MKLGIHPEYHSAVFQDATTGEQFLTGSTTTGNNSVAWTDGRSYPLIPVDITSGSHPFWTGTQRIVETAGQVEKFHRRYGRRSG